MIISICNQKGGVGKTAVATGLAQILASKAPTLLIDMDPQGNASQILNPSLPADCFTINDVLHSIKGSVAWEWKDTEGAVTQAGQAWPANLHFIPSNRGLAGREADVSIGRERLLLRALEGCPFQHVIIDCPPSLGMLTTNALVASNTALVVTEAQAESVSGVHEVLNTIAAVQQCYNTELKLGGILVNRHRLDRLDRLHWHEKIASQWPTLLIDDVLPERIAVSAARTTHQPLPETLSDILDPLLKTVDRLEEGVLA